MENQQNKTKRQSIKFSTVWGKIKQSFKHWYSFNKQKIPMIFVLLGTIVFTGFLDFEVQNTEIKLVSHIYAIQQLTSSTRNNLTALTLFLMYLFSLIQSFNAITFGKKRSPVVLIIMTFITVIELVLAFSYRAAFIAEAAARADYVIDSATRLAYTLSILGAILFLVGTIFAWVYVDWKYVKEKD
jgi:hypothetical protein